MNADGLWPGLKMSGDDNDFLGGDGFLGGDRRWRRRIFMAAKGRCRGEEIRQKEPPSRGVGNECQHGAAVEAEGVEEVA